MTEQAEIDALKAQVGELERTVRAQASSLTRLAFASKAHGMLLECASLRARGDFRGALRAKAEADLLLERAS